MPFGFALHTTSTTLGLATIDCTEPRSMPDALPIASGDSAVDRDLDLRVHSVELGREMLAHLHQHAQDFIAPRSWRDCAFIAVAKGPGSFTSTRIGVTAARTFGQQLQIPVYGISTLEAAAFDDLAIGDTAGREKPSRFDAVSGTRAVSLAAARGEVFAGIYRFEADRAAAICVRADAAMTPDAWAQILNRHGTIATLEASVDRLAGSTAALATLAYRRWRHGDRPHWSAALPFYGQHPVR